MILKSYDIVVVPLCFSQLVLHWLIGCLVDILKYEELVFV